jgi:CRISPR-associated exonuclease Cas4
MDSRSWWPDGDAGAGRIPLSALEHADYCLRQAALIHVDGVFLDDARTVSGTLAHRKVHELTNPSPNSEAGTRTVTGVPVWSERLGLYGICDAVEVSASSVLPVEHKIGPYHPGGPADVQAAAQAVCLAEMLGVAVPVACVFSHADRRRHRVEVTSALTVRIDELAAAIRQILGASHLPEAVHRQWCRRCSLRHDCLPNLASAVAAAPDPFTVPLAESLDD